MQITIAQVMLATLIVAIEVLNPSTIFAFKYISFSIVLVGLPTLALSEACQPTAHVEESKNSLQKWTRFIVFYNVANFLLLLFLTLARGDA